MQQERLFVLAHEAITVGAHFVRGEGWHVTIVARRGGESWSESPAEAYGHLSTSELVDVIERVLSRTLGL